MSNTTPPVVEAPQAGHRRRFTPEQKKALLDEARRAGNSISSVARRHGISPSQMFKWRTAMEDATRKSLKSNERVVPESKLKEAQKRIRELERMLGKKTMQVEILEEAVKIAKEKKWISGDAYSDKESGR